MPQFVGADEQGNLLYQNEDGSVTPVPAGLGFGPSTEAYGPVPQPDEIQPPSAEEFAPFQPGDPQAISAYDLVAEPVAEARRNVLNEPERTSADIRTAEGAPGASEPQAAPRDLPADEQVDAVHGVTGGQMSPGEFQRSSAQNVGYSIEAPRYSPEEIEAYRQRLNQEALAPVANPDDPHAMRAAGMVGMQQGAADIASGQVQQAGVEAAKERLKANAAGEQAQALQAQQDAMQAVQEEANANWQKNMEQVQASLDAVPQINPARIWEEGGTSTKVQGILLGFMAGFTGKTEFLDKLNKIIETDVNAQKANASQQFRKAGEQKKLMLMNQDRYADQQQFIAGQAALRTRQIIAEIDQEMGKYADPELQAKLAGIRGSLKQQLSQQLMQVSERDLKRQHDIALTKLQIGGRLTLAREQARLRLAEKLALSRAEGEKRGPGFNGEALGVTLVRRDEDGNVVERKNWIPALSNSHAQGMIAKAQGAYGQQRILDRMAEALDQAGESGGTFPWETVRQSLNQYKNQLLAAKIQAGGRAISDQDVERFEKALDAKDVGFFVNWKDKGQMRAALDRANQYTKDSLQSMTAEVPGHGWEVDFNPKRGHGPGGPPTAASGFTPGAINALVNTDSPNEFKRLVAGLQDTAAAPGGMSHPDPGLTSQLEAAKAKAEMLFNSREADDYKRQLDYIGRQLGITERKAKKPNPATTRGNDDVILGGAF